MRYASAVERTGVPASADDHRVRPFASWMTETAEVSKRRPPLAKGRYARAKSSGVTSKAPKAAAGTDAIDARSPSAFAVDTTAGRPTVRAIRTVAAFSEPSRARRTVTRPSFRPSKFRGRQGWP